MSTFSVMAPVSFIGLLDYTVSGESFSDNWYLSVRCPNPISASPRVECVLIASSSRCMIRTVTLGLTTGFESFCKDQIECLTKPADGKSFLCMGDTQSVCFFVCPEASNEGTGMVVTCYMRMTSTYCIYLLATIILRSCKVVLSTSASHTNIKI